MKKIIALVLVLCMSFGMVLSVSAAASPFIQRLSLVRLIRSMLSSDDEGYGIGEVKDNILTVYVAPNGKKDADGTAKNPMTLEAARDAVRDISKSGLKGIDILLKSGEYVLSETFALTEEDAGTEKCVVRYIGEDGATIIGGVALTAKDFAPATGNTAQYFADEVKDKIVQFDLKTIGITAEQMQGYFASRYYNSQTVRLLSDGEMQTIARYPNTDEDQLIIQYGSCTQDYGKEPKDWKDVMTFGVTDEVIARMRSWHTYEGVSISGYTDYLWRINNAPLTGLSADANEFYTLFPGTSAPRAGLEFYLYNIPEELDFPGEYYIDTDAVLYYYPTENFETATLSVPTVYDIITVTDADYTTFENLTVEVAQHNCFVVNADNVTIIGNEICGAVTSAISTKGYNNLVSTNHIHDIGAVGTTMDGGDEATLTSGNSLFTNNYCHDFGILSRGYNGALTLSGCGNTASHNEIFGGEHQGIHWDGTRLVIEYNYLHDLCTLADDMGAIYGGTISMVDCVVRYNYIANIGIDPTSRIAKLDGYPYCGSHAVYWDMYNGNNNTYGNVIVNIKGAGVAMGNGRNMYIADNLVISAHHVVTGICGIYVNAYYGTPSSHKNSLPAYMYEEPWTTEYPDMSKLVMDMTKTTYDDPWGWATPVNIVIKNNYFYGDKYNTGHRNEIQPLSLESPFYTLNPETIVDMTSANGTLVVFNSRREGMPEIKEALEKAAGTVSITYEQFCEMGTDWTPAE
ncbi:MAG: right-handed parallel beta-helix repeat-containing protein [Clostridia bacterium]|nr:right-handed parallel beta-helix repeat-containing protein [Clostridia bacterium]